MENQKTLVNGYAINGRCVVKATMDMTISQIWSFIKTKDENAFNKVVSKEITLVSTSNENMIPYIGTKVALDNSYKNSLFKHRFLAINNPRSLNNVMELLKNTKGKIVNDLINEKVKVEIWEYYLLFDSDITFLTDDNIKIESPGYLIPELEDRELAEGEQDEPNVLELDVHNTKLSASDINARLEVKNNE